MLKVTVWCADALQELAFNQAVLVALQAADVRATLYTAQMGDVNLLLPTPHTSGEALKINPQQSQLRHQLDAAKATYLVLHGLPDQQVAAALRAITRHSVTAPQRISLPPNGDNLDAASTWTWACDTCSDAACERKLLTDLLLHRGVNRPAALERVCDL